MLPQIYYPMVRNTVDAKLEKQLAQLAASLGHVAKKQPSSNDNLEDIQVRKGTVPNKDLNSQCLVWIDCSCTRNTNVLDPLWVYDWTHCPKWMCWPLLRCWISRQILCENPKEPYCTRTRNFVYGEQEWPRNGLSQSHKNKSATWTYQTKTRRIQLLSRIVA